MCRVKGKKKRPLEMGFEAVSTIDWAAQRACYCSFMAFHVLSFPLFSVVASLSDTRLRGPWLYCPGSRLFGSVLIITRRWLLKMAARWLLWPGSHPFCFVHEIRIYLTLKCVTNRAVAPPPNIFRSHSTLTDLWIILCSEHFITQSSFKIWINS